MPNNDAADTSSNMEQRIDEYDWSIGRGWRDGGMGVERNNNWSERLQIKGKFGNIKWHHLRDMYI
jgi:hypothetical protein